MAGNSVKLEFAGDSQKLEQASKRAQSAVTDVGNAAQSGSQDMARASDQAQSYTDRVGRLGSAVTGATDAFDSIGGAMQAVADISDYSRARAERLARAEIDASQAMIDAKQSTIDLKQSRVDLAQANQDATQSTLDIGQAEIDAKQATLDAKTAQDDYNKAVKEHGRNSDEAKQASIDLTQANQDLKQADADLEQAHLDATQAETDMAQARNDTRQATLDGEEAMVNYNAAMHEANPPDLQTWADQLGMITPLLSAGVGVLGLITAAQWAWNAAQAASPLTWLLIGIAAIVAIIVLLATKTEWGRKAWQTAWQAMKDAAAAVGRWFRDTLWGSWIKGAWEKIVDAGKRAWEWMKALPGKLKDAFSSVTDFLFAPFRKAFNMIATAWNATVGSLSWTVPGWVPGVGGNTISVPNLPTFHQGGTVPGPPGADVLIRAQGGEQVSTRASTIGDRGFVPIRGDAVVDALIEAIARQVDRRGGAAAELGIRIS